MDVDIELYRRDIYLPARPPLRAPLRLSVIDISPDHPSRTLVFVHGFGGCAAQWKHQLQLFSDDSRTIALDLRGHGFSERPSTHYSLPELLGDLEQVIDALNIAGKFTLLGHSFGGALVTEYATAHPDRLEKLVLMATAGEFRLAPLQALALRLPAALLNLGHQLYFKNYIFSTATVMKAMYKHAVAVWNGWSLFRDLKTPTLVIRGHRDFLFAPFYFEEVARAIPGAEEVDLGVSGHLVMLERRDAVNRAIERFISGSKTRRDDPRQQLRKERPWLGHYEQGVPYTIGLPPAPMHHLLTSAARRFPFKTALIFQGHRILYLYLDYESSRFANLLVSLGVKTGDKVLILLPNLPQTVIAYYGALKAGAVAVFTTPLSEPTELARQARDAEAKVLVTLTRLAETVRAIWAESGLRHVLFTNVKDYLPWPSQLWFTLTREAKEGHRIPFVLEPGMHRWVDEIARHSPRAPEVDVKPDDLALIQYTSGTTALPKGVQLSHRNLVANALQTRHWIPALKEGQEVFLSVLPFSHVYGMTAAMNVPVALAATSVILPTFVTEDVLKAIRRYKPTIFPGVPTMFVAINNYPNVRRYGIRSIKACISGAAPLPVEVQEAFEKLTRGRLAEGYGLTEATTVTHVNPLNGRRKIGHIGIPLPSTEAKIIDIATGVDLPPGQLGELAVRGPQVMLGYWKDDALTQTCLTPDGWLLTGDLARMDNDGYFEVVTRKRDMILAGDYQVYPRDVEEVLYEHPKVKEVAVVGIQTPESPTQRVKAYVVLKDGVDLSEAELMALCKRRLEEYAIPWQIEFRAELPRSFMGKILRRLLVEDVE